MREVQLVSHVMHSSLPVARLFSLGAIVSKLIRFLAHSLWIILSEWSITHCITQCSEHRSNKVCILNQLPHLFSNIRMFRQPLLLHGVSILFELLLVVDTTLNTQYCTSDCYALTVISRHLGIGIDAAKTCPQNWKWLNFVVIVLAY